MQYTNGREPHEISPEKKAERDTLLGKLKEAGLSIRQIERVTSIFQGVVTKKLTKKERPQTSQKRNVPKRPVPKRPRFGTTV